VDPSPGSLVTLRQNNRKRVLEVIRRRGTVSRSEIAKQTGLIAKQTGLSTTTVANLVAELLGQAVIVEQAPRPNSAAGGGRPATTLFLNPAAGCGLGIHLAHDHIRIGLTDLAGNVVAEQITELDVDHQPTQSLAYAAQVAIELIATAGLKPTSIAGLGVAVSAPVSGKTHALGAGPILPDWRGIDVARELHRWTGLRVEVGNDANLGAIAEHRYGVARGVDDFVYVMLSDGVGAGLFLDGHLYCGATGGAGELGHVTVVPGGFVCRCGNRGCLETVAGAHALTGALAQTHGSSTTLADLMAAAQGGESGALRVLADAGRAVGTALATICMILDPALVVIGGKANAEHSPLLSAVRDTLADSITPLRKDPIPVVAGTLGEQAEMLGAIALATQTAAIG